MLRPKTYTELQQPQKNNYINIGAAIEITHGQIRCNFFTTIKEMFLETYVPTCRAQPADQQFASLGQQESGQLHQGAVLGEPTVSPLQSVLPAYQTHETGAHEQSAHSLIAARLGDPTSSGSDSILNHKISCEIKTMKKGL